MGSVYSLITNIQALIKVAVENAKKEERNKFEDGGKKLLFILFRIPILNTLWILSFRSEHLVKSAKKSPEEFSKFNGFSKNKKNR